MADAVLTIEQGVNCTHVFEPFEDDALTTRTSLVPADWRVVLQFRRRRGAETALVLELDSDDVQQRLLVEDATEAPAGQWIRLQLRADDTAAILHEGFWELARVDRNDPNNVDPLGTDKFKLVARGIW